MSAANAARSIRNDVPGSRPSLREQMRGNESLLEEEYPAAEGSLESLVKPLSARQQTAINLLSMGKSAIATAKTIGVSESTLHRWKATHPLFKAELGRRQHDLFDGMVTRLRMSMSNAIDELNSILTGDRSDLRRGAMWQMLKLLKPQKYLVPDEPSTMQAVLDEQIRDERAQRGEIPEAPIDDEQRAAAIPEEYRAKPLREEEASCDDLVRGRQVERSETPGPAEAQRAKSTSLDAPSSQILRCAQDDDAAQHRHVERSETSGASERQSSSPIARTPARREPTPLPSRKCDRRSLNRGQGEGAASDEVGAEIKGVVKAKATQPQIVNRAEPADATSARIANADHAQSSLEKVIASRPLLQPLAQGEGSQNTARDPTQHDATSLSVDAPSGQILRFAQNDETTKVRRVEPSESPDPPESTNKSPDFRTS